MISDDACYVKCGEQHPLMLVGRRYEQLIQQLGAKVIAARKRLSELGRQFTTLPPDQKREWFQCSRVLYEARKQFKGAAWLHPPVETREDLIEHIARGLVELAVFDLPDRDFYLEIIGKWQARLAHDERHAN